MTYLLDTHVWLWMLADPDRIRPDLLAELQHSRTRLLLSAASSWEIAIKWTMGRLPLPEPPDTYVPTRMRRTSVLGLAELPLISPIKRGTPVSIYIFLQKIRSQFCSTSVDRS